MKIYRVPQRTSWLWVIRISIAFFCIVAALKMFHVKQNLFFAITTATVIIAVAVVLYLWVYAKSYEIIVSSAAIIVKSGVVIKKERILPSPRLIYAEVYVTPLERLLRLKVIVFRSVKIGMFTMSIDSKDTLKILGEVSGYK